MMNNGFTFGWMWYISGVLPGQAVSDFFFLEVLLPGLVFALCFICLRASFSFSSPQLLSDNMYLKINQANVEMLCFLSQMWHLFYFFTFSAFKLGKNITCTWTHFLSMTRLIFYAHLYSKTAVYTWLYWTLSRWDCGQCHNKTKLCHNKD